MKPARHLRLIAPALLALLLIGFPQAEAQAQPALFAHPAFQGTWTRTDGPVAQGRVGRTWFWGPQANSPGLLESYTDAPDGSGKRLVQYFDKSRMELNNPNGDPNSPFFITNGLLTVELISGCLQTGNAPCGEQRQPAAIPMTGDAGDELAPTYAAFLPLANTAAGDHPADNRSGQNVTATVDHSGAVGDDASKAGLRGTRIAYYAPETQHNIPEAFWNFLNQSGPIVERDRLTVGPLINPWFYASGYPISEAYWAQATIGGETKDVMIQAYERRVLTFVPTNAPVWQVEMGNIGQHYYSWRYAAGGAPASSPPAPTSIPSSPTAGAETATTTPAEATLTPVPATPLPTDTATPAAPDVSPTP